MNTFCSELNQEMSMKFYNISTEKRQPVETSGKTNKGLRTVGETLVRGRGWLDVKK